MSRHKAMQYKIWESFDDYKDSNELEELEDNSYLDDFKDEEEFEDSGYFNELAGIRYPEQMRLSKSDKDWVNKLEWKDLDWEQIGDNGTNIVWLQLKVPLDKNILRKGVVVDIQIIKETLYQIHITIAEELRGIGLGTKIYRSLIDWLGHLYSGKGRRQNPIINKVWKGLSKEAGVTCANNDLGDICVSDRNPMKLDLLKIFR